MFELCLCSLKDVFYFGNLEFVNMGIGIVCFRELFDNVLKFCVFIDIRIGYGISVVIVLGLNVGGKIVFMKILGLVFLMLKVGLYLFVKGYFKFFWFDFVFVDIGDR